MPLMIATKWDKGSVIAANERTISVFNVRRWQITNVHDDSMCVYVAGCGCGCV